MVVIAELIVLVGALPRREVATKLMSQLPSPKVTGLSSSPVLERAPGRDGVGGQCNWPVERSGVEKLGGTRPGSPGRGPPDGPCPHLAAVRGQGPCPYHAWAVERSNGLCRQLACGAERGRGRVRIMLGRPGAAMGCVGGQHLARSAARGRVRIMLGRPSAASAAVSAASMRRGARQGVGSSLRSCPRLLGV